MASYKLRTRNIIFCSWKTISMSNINSMELRDGFYN